MENIKVEYIVIFDKDNSICSNKKALNMLLQSNAMISISGSTITYKSIKIKYSVETGKINDDETRYFHLQFILSDENKITDFEDFLKSVRQILNNNSSRNIEALWNDISYYYAMKSYPLIHEIENLMRKLITKIMLVNIGVGWTSNSVPDVVKESIRTKKKNERFDTEYLYQTDFIQLSNFLFEEYSTDSSKNLIDKLKEIKDDEKITVEMIKKYIPQSNWERYFSRIVDCEYEFLKKRWEELYDLRCKVAHNNQINLRDYERILLLVNEIKAVLNEAIKNIDKLEVDVVDREIISESMILNTNKLYGEYITSWKNLEMTMTYYIEKRGLVNSRLKQTPIDMIEIIANTGGLPSDKIKRLKELRKIRNLIVHQNGVFITENQINIYLSEIDEIIIWLTSDIDLIEINDLA